MTADFPTRLAARLDGGAAPIALGLDPRLEALPAGLLPAAPPPERIAAFASEVLPAIAPHAPVLKPNIAFFERYGAAGFEVYERVCRQARALGMLVIGDIKRGDIGSTAEAYAAIHLELADAVTLQPYLGRDSVAPFLRRCRDDARGVFVLVRTTNASASDLQDLPVGGRPLYEIVAKTVARWGSELGPRDGWSPVGAVAAATRPADLGALRQLMPRAWLLLPGVGAQGGEVAACRPAFDRRGHGALLSQSRGVMQCFSPSDRNWLQRITAAAEQFARAAMQLREAIRSESPR